MSVSVSESSDFTLAAGTRRQRCPGVKEMENIHFLRFPPSGETKGEREVLQSDAEIVAINV